MGRWFLWYKKGHGVNISKVYKIIICTLKVTNVDYNRIKLSLSDKITVYIQFYTTTLVVVLLLFCYKKFVCFIGRNIIWNDSIFHLNFIDMHQFYEHLNSSPYKNNLFYCDSYPGAWKSLWYLFTRELEENQCWKSETKYGTVLTTKSFTK